MIKTGSALQKIRIFSTDGQNNVLNCTVTKLKGTQKYLNTHQLPTQTVILFSRKK